MVNKLSFTSMKIHKGDKVKILKGKDRGKEGMVEGVFPSQNKVVIAGINVFKKHLKARGRRGESGIIDVVRPIPVANVMIICPKCNQQTRVDHKISGKKKNRVCKKCGEILDLKKV